MNPRRGFAGRPAAWLIVPLIAALAATAIDAALLQRARAYFTGGFLAADSARTLTDVLGFLLGSLASDIGTAGVFAALLLWLLGRWGAPATAAAILAVGLSLVPMAVTNFAEYELATYLGDAFDLRLMFELAGGDWREFMAVGWSHVASIVLVGAPLLALTVWAGLVLRRRLAGQPWPRHPSLGAVLVRAVAVVLFAAVSTTLLRGSSDVLDNGLRRKPSGQWLGALVNTASDLDRDGYGLLGRPRDPQLLDARIHPYAIERAGNGVDEDGVAGDLPADAPAYREAAAEVQPWSTRRDVLLVVLESFRADAVGATLAGRPVTPTLDELARRGVASAAAYSHNGYTVQARHHIFSGSLADLRGGTSLIDDFKANGYETAYFSGQDESFGGSAFGVGFERADVAYDARVDKDKRYSAFTTAGSLAVSHKVLAERVAEFLKGRSRSKPLFLYVNFHDTHFPYHHEDIEPLLNRSPLAQSLIAPGRRAELRSTYLNTAANVDRAIGHVLETLRGHLGQEPGVVVLADHGESLFDEGFLGHGYALNDAQTRIPFIVHNLPLHLEEPIGQSDLRDAIRAAMARPADDSTPRLSRSGSRRIFQYLGNLARPAQIALTGTGSQIAYDFRDGRVRVDRAAWEDHEGLSPADAERWRTLVSTWEAMVIARTDAEAQVARQPGSAR